MVERTGIAVSPGLASAPAFVLPEKGVVKVVPKTVPAHRVDRELMRLTRAMTAVRNDILAVRAQAEVSGSADVVRIIETHVSLLEDPSMVSEIQGEISRSRKTAESAVHAVFEKYVGQLRGLPDKALAHRAEDLQDVGLRLLRHLVGAGTQLIAVESEVVLVASELLPSQTASLDPDKVVGIVTEQGGPTSHAAIVAKGMGIPAVAGVEGATADIRDGMILIVDGDHGRVVIEPDPAATAAIPRRKTTRRVDAGPGALTEVTTADGEPVRVDANVSNLGDVEAAVRYGADGIGLFRTEFLYQEPGKPPSEDLQLETYRQAALLIGGKPLTIRTMDFGGDKPAPATGASRERGAAVERNPALGNRSLRYSFEHIDLLETQLRAVCRAAVRGPLKLLFPMVTCVDELRRVRGLLEEACRTLGAERARALQNISVGVMLEVPAAVLIAGKLFAEADFASIGTNDLVQYTLAVDRTNEQVAELYQPTHPGVLRLLFEAIEAARHAGKPISVCGEAGADPAFSYFLLGLGMREWSVAAPLVPAVKERLAHYHAAAAAEVAARACQLATAQEVDDLLTEAIARELADLAAGAESRTLDGAG